MPTIGLILSWAYHGLIQYILYWIPLLTPFREADWPPGEWWWHNTWADWFDHLDEANKPDEYLIQRWWVMVAGEVKRFYLAAAEGYVDAVRDWLSDRIGWARTGFANVADWVGAVEDRVGRWLPWWVTTLGKAVDWLRDRLPVSIREGWLTWYDLFEWLKSSVRDWAMDRFDYAAAVALFALGWITVGGVPLYDWWHSAHEWLDWFREDPKSAVLGYLGGAWAWLVDFSENPSARVWEWLGPDFPQLLVFSRNCVVFYYNLWNLGWRELADFVTDPLHWVTDRLERALVERW